MKVPHEVFTANLQALGRSMDELKSSEPSWRGDEFGVQMVWNDGSASWVGMGEQATAIVQAYTEGVSRTSELAAATIEARDAGPKH